MGQEITILVESLSTFLSITNKGDEHHNGPYDTSLTRPNVYVGNDMDLHDHTLHLIFTCNWKLDDKGNWVRKFDRQSSMAQALTIPPLASQTSDAPRSPHEA
ncbi:hypothetical protein Gotur_023822, partial [Gossypium turneri]